MNTGIMITGANLLGIGITCILAYGCPLMAFGDWRQCILGKYPSIASACAVITGGVLLCLSQ